MSLLQLPFEVIEAIINELDADSLLVLLQVMPDPYKCCILVSLLHRANDLKRLKEYLDTCKPSFDLLKECLFCLKRHGQLYIIAEVFKTTDAFEAIEGLREQDLMESVRDLIKQGHTELAKRFLLSDGKYKTKTAESLQIYAIEQKLGDNKQSERPKPHTSCTIDCKCKIPWYLLHILQQAHILAKRGDVDICKHMIYQAQAFTECLKLPEPDTRQLEETMYQNAVRMLVQRVKHFCQIVDQNNAPIIRNTVQACRNEITKAEQMAKEGGLSEPEIEVLKKKIETMESQILQKDMRAHEDGREGGNSG